MSLAETYSRVRVDKNVSYRFPIRNGLEQGDALSPMLFNFALEYTISTFERVEEFKYVRTNLTNQNSIAEEIKSRLRSGKACYHLVQNLFVFQAAIQKLKDQDI